MLKWPLVANETPLAKTAASSDACNFPRELIP
jgi:hypothetical protein